MPHYTRFTDRDRRWGPFVFSTDAYSFFSAAFVATMDRDNHTPKLYNYIKLSLFKKFFLVVYLPALIGNLRIKRVPGDWDENVITKDGRGFYYEDFNKEYGFSFSEEAVHLRYGPQTHDSSTTKSRLYFLPWTQLTYLKAVYLNLDQSVFKEVVEKDQLKLPSWVERREVTDKVECEVPKVQFKVIDYDGEIITGTAYGIERHWSYGSSWMSWLKYIKPNMVVARADISFEQEVGSRKGSWKGGLMGTSIILKDKNETIQEAVIRYCSTPDGEGSRSINIKFLSFI